MLARHVTFMSHFSYRTFLITLLILPLSTRHIINAFKMKLSGMIKLVTTNQGPYFVSTLDIETIYNTLVICYCLFFPRSISSDSIWSTFKNEVLWNVNQKTDNLGPSPSSDGYYILGQITWRLWASVSSFVKCGWYKTTWQNYFKDQIIYKTL